MREKRYMQAFLILVLISFCMIVPSQTVNAQLEPGFISLVMNPGQTTSFPVNAHIPEWYWYTLLPEFQYRWDWLFIDFLRLEATSDWVIGIYPSWYANITWQEWQYLGDLWSRVFNVAITVPPDIVPPPPIGLVFTFDIFEIAHWSNDIIGIMTVEIIVPYIPIPEPPPVEDTEAFVAWINGRAQELPEEKFKRPEEDVPDVKNDLSDLFSDVLENIKEGNIIGAIQKLNRIRNEMFEEIVVSAELIDMILEIEQLSLYLQSLL